MQFLLAAMRKNARRMQLQQWLLLAVRTLIIVLVVLAVAEPYGARPVAGGTTAAPLHKVLVIDGSYSMAYPRVDNTHFARAKQLAAELVRRQPQADAFTVILMADPAKTIVGREVVDPAAVATQIRVAAAIACRRRPRRHARPGCRSAAERQRQRPPRPEPQEVYFFTDLQRSTWRILWLPRGAGERWFGDRTQGTHCCRLRSKPLSWWSTSASPAPPIWP